MTIIADDICPPQSASQPVCLSACLSLLLFYVLFFTLTSALNWEEQEGEAGVCVLVFMLPTGDLVGS